MYYVVSLLVLYLVSSPLKTNSQSRLRTNSGQSSCEVWGQVAGSSRLLQDGLNIELIGRDKALKRKVHLAPDGNFVFPSMPPGTYQFRVLDSEGKVVHEQGELLTGKNDYVLLLIRDPGPDSFYKNTVSFTALQHKAPSRAWDAFREAQKARNMGDMQGSIQHLQQALSIDPDFAEAHSDLAAIFSKLQRLDDALEHAEAAVTLNPNLPEAGCNLALLLANLKKYEQAELLARRFLTGPYPPPQIQGVLAVSLIGQKRNLGEAFVNLDRAGKEIPFIRLLAARTLVEIRRPDLALIQVRAYLQSSAHDCERDSLENWANAVQSKLEAAK